MKRLHSHHRPGLPAIALSAKAGTTLVELLLFLAFFAVVGGTVVSILFATSDQRARQQTIASVERAGLQALQGLRWRVEHAERIIDPPGGSTGSILSLQMTAESDDPLVVGVESGALVLVLHESKKTITPEEITVSHFVARNLSPASDHPTVLLSFDLAETYPLPSVEASQYVRHFEMAVQLLPKDSPAGNACGCPAPVCQSGVYEWQVCTGQDCSTALTALPCL